MTDLAPIASPESTGGTAKTHVVVGVDGSEPSRQALLWAQFFATTTASAITAVHVWQMPASFGWSVVGDWNPGADAALILDSSLREAFGGAPPTDLTAVVEEGNTAQVLLDLSKDATMLILGSRGHGGFSGLLLGSVSASCAEHAGCPVLVVHGETPPPPPIRTS